jgi:predicted PurR-regulated permease PerM
MELITSDEKIDYIYKEMKAHKRARIFSLLTRLMFIWVLIFLYFTFIYWIDQEVIIEQLTQVVSDIAKPITENLVNDMLNQDSTWTVDDISQWLMDKLKDNPDLLDNFR